MGAVRARAGHWSLFGCSRELREHSALGGWRISKLFKAVGVSGHGLEGPEVKWGGQRQRGLRSGAEVGTR